MVPIVESSDNVRQTLLYNEEKLAENKALFLGAFNYWQEDAELTFGTKLKRLHDRIIRNQRSEARTIHFSLNFHPDDQLTDQRMLHIARQFLSRIDMGDQPALVYRHVDAGHPHAHIVTTSIRPDGSRIKNDKRSPRHMHDVCQQLEWKYNLVRSHKQSHALEDQQRDFPMEPNRLVYGQTPTKSGISNILDYVLPRYSYTTLEELNIALRRYHVRVDRGKEGSRMYLNRGLYYRMIDENGVKIGAPIKASAFPQRPTLDYLEQRFAINQELKQKYLVCIRSAIDWTIYQKETGSLDAWTDAMRKDRVRVVFPLKTIRRRKSPTLAPLMPVTPTPYDGHGFFYIHTLTNTICRDTDLGPTYTAAAILQRTGLDATITALAQNNRLTLTPQQQSLLRQPNPDPKEKLHLLLALSPQQDHIHKIAEEIKQQQEEKLQQTHRLRIT